MVIRARGHSEKSLSRAIIIVSFHKHFLVLCHDDDGPLPRLTIVLSNAMIESVYTEIFVRVIRHVHDTARSPFCTCPRYFFIILEKRFHFFFFFSFSSSYFFLLWLADGRKHNVLIIRITRGRRVSLTGRGIRLYHSHSRYTDVPLRNPRRPCVADRSRTWPGRYPQRYSRLARV